mmetsp:Transcript_23743/g.27890  ORF Transcript_23743/g.27890 Transcript_23743/m.27890 type:complete len:458 (-) Transcript_23743:1423-2796(-)
MVYLLKKKSDAPLTVKTLHDYYENHNIKISKIRTDQGGEYIGGHIINTDSIPKNTTTTAIEKDIYGTKFKAACDTFKIEHELCPAYRPELHGIAERWNRTIMKMANAMMYEARLATPLWSSAVSHANLLRNRLPVAGLGALTPYEIFHGRRPRVDQLRVWGSFCWKLIPVRNKIPGQMIRKRLIYVGESPHRIGFKCFNPDTSKFTTEFELIFDEHGLNKRPQLLDDYDHHKPLADSEIIKAAGYESDDYNLNIARHIFFDPKASPSTVMSELGGDRRRNSNINSNESNTEEAITPGSEEVSEEAANSQPTSPTTGSEEVDEEATDSQPRKWPRISVPNHQQHNQPSPIQLPTSNPTTATSKPLQMLHGDSPPLEADSLGPLSKHNLDIALEESSFNFDLNEPKLPRRSTGRGIEDHKEEANLVKWIKVATEKNYPIAILERHQMGYSTWLHHLPQS